MNIVFSTDDRYAPYCGISMISLLENNKGENINIYIVGNNLTDSAKESLRKTVQKYNANIEILDMDSDFIKKCPPLPPGNEKFISHATYIRLFFPTILPDIKKVLYLDCDIIIEQNIKQLWDTDITDYSAAGIIDIMAEEKRFDGYVNGGILLINLDYWRKNNIQDNFIEYLENGGTVQYYDQDVINYVLTGTILHLPMKYNVQACFYSSTDAHLPHQSEINEATKDIAILHFTGDKPWWKDIPHSKKEIYRQYVNKSEWKWKDICIWSPYIDNKFRRKFRFYKKRLLGKLG